MARVKVYFNYRLIKTVFKEISTIFYYICLCKLEFKRP